MSETWKMYLWMGIALIDTYILIKDKFKGGNREHDRKSLSRSKRK